MIAIAAKLVPVDGAVHPFSVTVSPGAHTSAVALAVITPPKPCMLAVIFVAPYAVPVVVTRPLELIVAMSGVFDFQVTSLVMSRVDLG